MMTVHRRLHGRERGSASVELIGFLPYLFLAVLFGWQILLSAFTAVNAENAARNGSRVEGRGGDGTAAAMESLAPWLRDNATASIEGERASVTVNIPIVFPAFTNDALTVTRSATLPSTE
jgi:hypothetical protein